MKDPELYNGVQDADLEMAELTQAANRETRLMKRGICTHGWLQGPPGHVGQPTSVVTCKDCGQVFKTFAEAYGARREALL